METLFSKLIGLFSRYEIITNLIPGALLVFLLHKVDLLNWSDNIYLNIATCYFVGMINNRFSSLCIEEPMRHFKLIKWRGYDEYNKAKQERPFIASLQESANQFRAMAAVFILTVFALIYKYVATCCSFVNEYGWIFVVLLLIVLFVASYRKQINDYVVKNIDEVTERV